MPTIETVRDEFNAYKKTSLQEYLYELLFKDEESEEESFSLAMPSLSSIDNGFNEELKSNIDKLAMEVL